MRMLLFTALLAWPLQAGAQETVTADRAWARAPAGEAGAVAVYLTLHGGTAPDRLTEVSADIAGMAMLHQSSESGGVSSMTMLDGVDIPAGAEVALRPGGTHVMLEALARPPRVGETFRLTLRFAHAPARTVDVAVRPAGSPEP